MVKQFFKDIREMHWVPRLFLALIILKTIHIMIREASYF